MNRILTRSRNNALWVKILASIQNFSSDNFVYHSLELINLHLQYRGVILLPTNLVNLTVIQHKRIFHGSYILNFLSQMLEKEKPSKDEGI